MRQTDIRADIMRLSTLVMMTVMVMVEGRVVLPQGGSSCPGHLPCIPLTACPAGQGTSKILRLQIIK